MMAGMKDWIHRMTGERDRAKALRVIRREYAAFGTPLDSLTDEEIEEGMTTASEKIRQMGLTAAEATTAFEAFGIAYREAFKDEGPLLAER